jgi:O-antigen/teichoic acid export membrane protein
MLVATNSQRVAMAGAIAEAIVNVTTSVYLARHIGAIGVAYGTLIGSFVSVGMHFGFNMHYTYSKFEISRTRLFLNGIARPALITVPSALLVHLWWSATTPAFSPSTWAIWALSTLLLMWYVGLQKGERTALVGTIGARLKLRLS